MDISQHIYQNTKKCISLRFVYLPPKKEFFFCVYTCVSKTKTFIYKFLHPFSFMHTVPRVSPLDMQTSVEYVQTCKTCQLPAQNSLCSKKMRVKKFSMYVCVCVLCICVCVPPCRCESSFTRHRFTLHRRHEFPSLLIPFIIRGFADTSFLFCS